MPSSDVPPPWFEDETLSDATVDRFEDRPDGVGSFPDGSFPDGPELSSSDEPSRLDEPAWHDDPAVRALVPSPEDEPTNPVAVNEWPASEVAADDRPLRTSVFVNGIATVVPLTRAQALARGFAVVDSEDELVVEPISNQTREESESWSESGSTADLRSTAPDIVNAPDIVDAAKVGDAPDAGFASEGELTRFAEVESAVRGEAWPAASWQPERAPASGKPTASDSDSLPWWLASMGTQPPAQAPGLPEAIPSTPLAVSGVASEPSAQVSGTSPDEPVEGAVAAITSGSDASTDRPLPSGPDLEPSVVEHPALAESAAADPVPDQPADQLVGGAVFGDAPTFAGMAPNAADAAAVLSWLRTLAPAGATPEPASAPLTPIESASPMSASQNDSPSPTGIDAAPGFVDAAPPTSTGYAVSSDTVTRDILVGILQAEVPRFPVVYVGRQDSVEGESARTVEPFPIEVTGGSDRNASLSTESNLRFSTGPWASPAPAIDASTPVIIEATGLGRTFRKGSRDIVVLHDIDLAIHQGEFVAITGPSGSGKTTLLHCLAGLDDLTAGSVVVDGFELHNLTDGERSRHRSAAMGFAFQSYNLVPSLTALENVELPLMLNDWPQDRSVDEARSALELVGLSDRADFQPDELSGGEQQRIAIARAFVGEPKVLWADEPTGNLDDATADQVLQVFRELNHSGLTIVMVTHDPALARLAHRVIELSAGEIRRVNERVPS